MTDENETTQEEETVQDKGPPPQPIVATAGKYFRNMRYLFTAVMIGFGLWCVKDGYFSWPEHNRQVAALTQQIEEASKAGRPDDAAKLTVERNKMGAPKDTMGIFLNRVLAVALPILGITLLGRWLHISRGEYRLAADTLHAPGHPPIPLGNFTNLDDDLWDKKGVASAQYVLGDGTEGTVKLDDFVYEQAGIDGIHDWIRTSVDTRATTA